MLAYYITNYITFLTVYFLGMEHGVNKYTYLYALSISESASLYTVPIKTSPQLRVLFEHHSEIHSHQASHKTKEVNAHKVSAKCGGLITILVRDLSHTHALRSQDLSPRLNRGCKTHVYCFIHS